MKGKEGTSGMRLEEEVGIWSETFDKPNIPEKDT